MVAGDEVDVEVADGLAGSGALIDADIKTLGLEGPEDFLPGDGDSGEESMLFGWGGLEPRGNMPARDEQPCVPRLDETIRLGKLVSNHRAKE